MAIIDLWPEATDACIGAGSDRLAEGVTLSVDLPRPQHAIAGGTQEVEAQGL